VHPSLLTTVFLQYPLAVAENAIGEILDNATVVTGLDFMNIIFERGVNKALLEQARRAPLPVNISQTHAPPRSGYTLCIERTRITTKYCMQASIAFKTSSCTLIGEYFSPAKVVKPNPPILPQVFAAHGTLCKKVFENSMFVDEKSENPSVEQLTGVTSALRKQCALDGHLKALWRSWELCQLLVIPRLWPNASAGNASQCITK
jgi:hypothetical protein